MKIAIINLTSGGMSGGYRKYLREVLPRLAMAPDIDTILCAYPDSINRRDILLNSDNIEYVPYTPGLTIRSVKRQLFKRLKTFGPDILFFPSARCFRFGDIPVVIMIQNMEPLVQIEGTPLIDKVINFARKKEAIRSMKKSTRIIAISEFVRQAAIGRLGADPAKIEQIYLGATQLCSNDAKKPPIVPESWGGHFLFTAGAIRPGRGLEDLVSAMKSLETVSHIFGLVIAGNVDKRMDNYKKQLVTFLDDRRLADRVIWTGTLTEQEMSWCYKNSMIFVMTSRVEACPNIAIEAMAHGCVCIASDNDPLPEIFDNGALYYSAKNGEELAKKIVRITASGHCQAQAMSHQAINRSIKFSWEKCAAQTVSVFKSMCGTTPSAFPVGRSSLHDLM
ncbi:MAG: glycosyltransferase family 1 protein [Syntrophales bacterium]|jgi:glycosyltransferase involved in cell wall biosynthesis